MTASECYYNGGKILQNTSTSYKDSFLGAVKPDKKKKIFSYHWYKNFKPFAFGWVIFPGFGWLWMIVGWFRLVVSGFGWLWVVVGGFGWLRVL